MRSDVLSGGVALLPCPFCGGVAQMRLRTLSDEAARSLSGFFDRSYFVRCRDCHAETMAESSVDEAADLWNWRKGTGHGSQAGVRDLANRCSGFAEAAGERCDRAALLELAAFLEDDARELCQKMVDVPLRFWDGSEPVMAQQESWIAREIRKACGIGDQEVRDAD